MHKEQFHPDIENQIQNPDEAKAESDLMNLLSQKYSNISTVIMGNGEICVYSVWLKVGVQSFCITQHPFETIEDAE